jgi:cytochrome c-type biogenesis protein CcmF
LAIAAFSLSLLGTFLVRSGVLTSVHAFASDPQRGLFILIFLALVVGGSLLLYALRAPREDHGQPFAAMSRETLLLVNNLLLTTAAAMVLLGTLYPLLAEALDLGKISVGPPYFGLLFALLMLPLLALVPFGPLTRWQRDQARLPFGLLAPWAGLAIAVGAVAFFVHAGESWKIAAAITVGLWLLLGVLRFVRHRVVQAKGRLTAEMIGMCLAHAGLGVFFFGVLMTEGGSIEKDVAAKPGQTFSLRGYDFRFDGVARFAGPNYEAERGTVVVTRGDRPVAVLHPEKRAYASGGNVLTEAAIDGGVSRDLYVALGDAIDGNGSWALRLHVKPFIRWIWFGALMMAIGGFVVTLDKRFRRPIEARTS